MAQESGGHQYTTASWWRHLVSKYTGLTFLQIAELNYLQYLIWRRDAYIDWLNSFEAGRDYLDNAYRMEQTQPDRKRLRETFGKEDNK